jgi:nucleoside-diphosphate-sugar epimerase
MEDPFTDLQINSLAQLSILETCRRHNPDIKIVFASTRQIYGRPEYLPVDEKHPLRPVDVNGINKLAGEQYHRLYNDVYGIRTCSLRLTNTYGPRMRIRDARQTFVGLWIRQAIEGRAFDVWGGDQRRDFIYVDDAVDAFLKAAESDRADGQVFNLGGREVISLRQLAAMLTDLTSTPHVTIPFPENRKAIDIGDYYSDNLKIRSELGWEPVIGLEIGLRRTIAYFRENLDRYV